MAVERAQLEVASPSEDDVRAADRLPSTPPPPPPSLHRLHPSPVLYCEPQRQPGRVSAVCVRVCVFPLCACVCVFVAADQRQLGGGGRGGGRWYLVPPPTSPPLCICPSQFEQRVFFLPASLFSSPLLFYPLIDSEREREQGSKRERKREGDTQPFPA